MLEERVLALRSRTAGCWAVNKGSVFCSRHQPRDSFHQAGLPVSPLPRPPPTSLPGIGHSRGCPALETSTRFIDSLPRWAQE